MDKIVPKKKVKMSMTDLIKAIEDQGYTIVNFRNGETNYEPNTVVIPGQGKSEHLTLTLQRLAVPVVPVENGKCSHIGMVFGKDFNVSTDCDTCGVREDCKQEYKKL